MVKVMFVCLGNICRSPMAEAILKNLAYERDLGISADSCGTASYHVGYSPDLRTIATLEKHGISYKHRAQQINISHFSECDYLVVMDDSNKANALKVCPVGCEEKVLMMRDFDPIDPGASVDDPWYGDVADFEICYETLERSLEGFLHFLVEKNHIHV